MRRVLVTGGSMGIGLAVAQALAARGDCVVLVARGESALSEACAGLSGDGHEYHAFDVSDEGAWGAISGPLDGLVCAAAVLAPVGRLEEIEPAAFKRTLEVNLFGTMLAVRHCRVLLEGRPVVTFGGGGATGPLARFDAYATSKAAVVRLTENLAADGFQINCVAPGFVATRMHEVTLAAGPDAAGADYHARTERDLAAGGVPATEAAELVCRLLDGVPFSGRLISAQWDPWRTEQFHTRLAHEPNLATLRRVDGVIVGEL